ncbi:ABC transporter ATP-binding protein [Candidatus Bipolaricaulota bacterium]|nr:ABC transporter ATP-binding protein [Candidatus Bipolaricaulota bacterium]
MPSILEAHGLSKRFGDLNVLDDVTFTLGERECLAILGPSGCGKTTLLRILLGLEPADRGSFSRPLDRAGYLPQGSLLLPWKRVIENIELPMQIQGVDRNQRRARIRSHLATFGLEGFETAYPHELSGGMQQRVALLRAIMAGATILILDEPFGALDTVTRHRLQDWLAGTLEHLACAMIFVTHDLEEAIVLAHRILVLSERPARLLGEQTPGLSPALRISRLSPEFLDARLRLVNLIVSGFPHA